MSSWGELEDYVLNLLRNMGIKAWKPKGSGSVHHDLDIVSDVVSVECKYTKRDRFTISVDLIREMLQKAQYSSGIKTLAIEMNGTRVFVLPENDFVVLLTLCSRLMNGGEE